jgi:hypothetical protein
MVVIAGDEFTLADLLVPESCPAVVWAAAQVRLGRAPLGASARVIAGDEIRVRLRQLAKNESSKTRGVEWDKAIVPERITVRRAGARISCAELGRQILSTEAPSSLRSGASPQRANEGLSAGEVECGATILRGMGITPMSTSWDPSRGGWEARARCLRPQDCVPFLVRWPGAGDRTTLAAASPSSATQESEREAVHSDGIATLLMRPGQKATLLWEQDGIRVIMPAVSLDRGAVGDSVRARIAPGGRILHAIVVSASLLRVAS